MPLKVRPIDIFVSSPEDVQKERSLAERVIRSIAAEFGVPVTVNYSNWLRKVSVSEKVPAQNANGADEGRTWLRPCFWEYQNSNLDRDYCEQIPNTGSYDLVISILWSRLGTKLSSAFIMPDGTTPATAHEYEIAWVLDQLARTPGFPELHVYRNRTTPTAPVQPREQRETFFSEWDAVQNFFSAWGEQPGFTEACSDYSDLQEFESLFREHFREFLKRQIEKEIVPRKTPARGRSWEFNPFRGLQYFDFDHSPIFNGRTKAVGEVVDALNEQAIAKKPFVLILGPSGSGKTSLVRGGVLPLLTELATVMGEGPWRRVTTRPGSGSDPFDALATALLANGALPELQKGKSRDGHRTIAEELRERPEALASRIGEVLDQISEEELDALLVLEKDLSPSTGRIESAELARHRRLRRAKPKAQLAIFVDQLEDLFSNNYPEETLKSYISTLGALVRSQKVHIIAALRSEFYGSYQQSPELIALTGPSGRFDLQAPTRDEICRIVRSPAQASGLKYERDTKTGKSLDDALVDSALGAPDSLPLLEHLLSQLYIKQAAHKDGLLRWADYQDLGGFNGALSGHAERVFNSLRIDAQQTFEYVLRKLVFLEHDGRPGCRSVPYQDLVSARELDSHLQTSTQAFVDSMIAEGLFNTETDPKHDLMVQVAHPALLRNWPRVQEWLTADQEFVRMRDRVDGCLKLWLKNGGQAHDLLTPGLGLADGETLLNHFHSSLSTAQIEYIRKSLSGQRRSRRTTYTVLIAVLVALVCAATIAAVQRLTSEDKAAIVLEYGNLERKLAELVKAGHGTNQPEAKSTPTNQQATGAALSQQSTLEALLNETQDKLHLAQQAADDATTQRAALEAKVNQAQAAAESASAQRSALESQVKEAQEKLLLVQQAADQSATERSKLDAQLKESEDKFKQAQEASGSAAAQITTLQTQLKEAQDKLQQNQKLVEAALSQHSSAEAELKGTQEKLQQAQAAAESASSERSALESQLKEAQEKLLVVQQTADQSASERSSLDAQLKESQDKLKQAQEVSGSAAAQIATLQTQLKQAQDKLQQNQKLAEAALSQHSSAEAELKTTREKLQQAQAAAESASSERSALESQLKEAQEKLLLVQQTADQSASERSSLDAQLKESQDKLKQAQDKLQQNQKLAEAALSQHSSAEAELKGTQEKLQQAQAAAESASSERSALESQLKEAQQKLLLVQQSADQSASERSSFDARLKESQDKLKQAQEASGLAAAQITTLQAQLTKAEDSAHLAQQQAEEATSQRSALEAKLKEAENKAQLAQRITDLIEGQKPSAPNGSSPASPQNTEPAQQGRSGLALPLDADQNPGAKTSTQPLSPPIEPPNQ